MTTKILYLIDSLTEGAGRVVYDLARSLDKGRFEVMVATIYSGGELAEQLKKHKIRVVSLNKKSGKDLSIIFRLQRLMKKENIRIIHCHNSDAYEYGVIAAWLAGVRKIYATMHGKSVKRTLFKKARERFVNRFISLFLRRYIVVSDDLGRYAAKNWCFNRKKIRTIYNGIDTDVYKNKKKDLKLLSKLKLKKNDNILSIVAGLRKVKNHAILIRAMQIVKKTHPDTRLLVIGEGYEREALEDFTRRLDLQKEVMFLGYRDDIIGLFSLTDINILSSFSECLSITLLESMACETPSVVTRVGGNPEVVEDKEDGFLIQSDDHIELAEKILFLLDNKKARGSVAKSAREKVVNKFSIDRMIKEHEQLYLD